MAGIVNERYKWNVTVVRDSDSLALQCAVFGWDDEDNLLINVSTDAVDGRFTDDLEILRQDSELTGVGQTDDLRNPYDIRFKTYIYRNNAFPKAFEADSEDNAIRLLDDTVITEADEGAVTAYPGVTFIYAEGRIDFASGTWNTARGYDRSKSEDRTNPQALSNPLGFFRGTDGNNFECDLDWRITGITFDGQNKSINFGTGKVEIFDALGNLINTTIIGDLEITAATASAADLDNVTVNGDIRVNIGVNDTLQWNNVTCTGDVTNTGTSTLAIEKSGGSFTTSEPGTLPGEVDIQQSNTLTITGVPVDGILSLYEGEPIGTEDLGATLKTVNPTTGANETYIHGDTNNPIFIQFYKTGFLEVNVPFTLVDAPQSFDLSTFIEPETNL